MNPTANMKRSRRRARATTAAAIALLAGVVVAIQLLQQVGGAALVTASTQTADGNFGSSNNENYRFGSSPSGDDYVGTEKVIKMDMHPTSSYVRWLQLQLDGDEEVQRAALDPDGAAIMSEGGERYSEPGTDSRNEKRGGSSLRRLHSSTRNSVHDGEGGTSDYYGGGRRLIQQQLDDAMASLKGVGAAYASVMEFPSPASIENVRGDEQHRRHLKQSSRRLEEHNDAVREYNERYRKYSRYEWSIRNEEGLDGDGTATATDDSDISPLVGTSWVAVEIMPLDDEDGDKDDSGGSNATTPTQAASQHSVILSFDSDQIHMSVVTGGGCRVNYLGEVDHHHPDESSFTTSLVSGERALCGDDSEGEGTAGAVGRDDDDSYLHFVSGKKLHYELKARSSDAMGNGGDPSKGDAISHDGAVEEEEELELSLFTSALGPDRLSVPGAFVARFVPHRGMLKDEMEGPDGNRSMQSPVEGRKITVSSGAEGVNGSRKLQQDGRAKKKGGMFNYYQTSPLNQGYGTHYATIWVGTPSQRKSVIIDTGSHFTAFPCKGCQNCGEDHHTDKYFDPEASTTFRALTCEECQSAECEKGRCIFSQTYTEGSSWRAYEAIDKVFVGGRQLSSALNPINKSFQSDFLFGCQVKETGLFVTQLADGIMGMSAHPSTLPRVMFEQGKLEHNMFSMCFRRELHVSKQGIVAGMLTLGGMDTRVDFSPMLYARNVATSGWFTVFVKNVYVREKGGQRAKADGPHQRVQKINADIYQMNSGKGVIIDSGTTDTYLHESIARPFEKVWEKVTGGRKYSNEPVKMDEKDLLLLPTVLIQMAAYDAAPRPDLDFHKLPGLVGDLDPTSSQDILLAIPATHYMEYSPSKGTYTPRIYFTETKGGVIGANAMQGHNVLFDWENKRVGFAESSCEYQDEAKTVTEEGVMSVHCRLGAPSLSVSCSDSADLSRCERGANPDTALNGLEIWTRIVQAPGTPQGMTCEEVAMEQNEANGGGEMEVNCDGKGVCREVRKCVISCANAIAHGTTSSKSAALAPIGSCEQSWSACDISCRQTKVESVLMNDGKCHEEKSLQATRDCHVQACGRADPCRVPFVVHAIMKIRGGVAGHWNKHAEEIFAKAFSAKMNEKRKDVLFGPGDVVVLNASPWRASDDSIFGTSSLEGEDQELGMQLVVETSIFNPKAELPPTNGKDVPLATCHERDLQPLATIALNIHKKLAQPKFVDMMVELMKKDDSLGERTVSPFYYTFEDRKLAEASQVVTSWTIKTDIGTGTLTRIDFNSLGSLPMDLLLLSLLIVITVYSCWSLRLWTAFKSEDELGGRPPRGRRRGKYSRVEANGSNHYDDDNDTINSQMAIADDERSVMTANTDNTDGGESFYSIGSLSTYLARTSRRS